MSQLKPPETQNTESTHPPLKDKIVIEETPRTGITGEISHGLYQYNCSIIGKFPQKSFAIYMKNTADEVAGGLTASAYGRTCALHLVWVDQRYRRQGIGKKILQKLLTYAREFGSSYIILDTMEFQMAKEFYIKVGFYVVGGYKNGFNCGEHFLMRYDL